jgi:NAD(P)-dependent dehydrogenase (short-subunit alcohol dehydrogenase family)
LNSKTIILLLDIIVPWLIEGFPRCRGSFLEGLNLQDRVAVVTGGGSGIGKAICERMAAHGAHVWVLDIDQAAAAATAEGIIKAGGKATGSGCDVSDPASVTQVFETIKAEGPIHALVNSAGIAHIGTLADTKLPDFERLFRVNVQGVYLCMQAVIETMLAQAGGVIINMASVAAVAGIPSRFAYSMSKGAVRAMTLSVARDYVDKNIRCNCITPARVHTPFVDGFIRKNYPGKEAEMFKTLSLTQPVGRMAKPEEVAGLAVYLCSDLATFLTGADLPFDGGVLNLRA